MAAAAESKKNWSDQDIDEDKNDDMPSTTFVSPVDENGIKTVTEYRTHPDGNKVKVVRKLKVTKSKKKINRNVIARRCWAKFGDCIGKPIGPEDNITYPSGESIRVDLRAKKREDQKDDNPFDEVRKAGESIVQCRNCGKFGHWTLKCPERRKIGMSVEELAQNPDNDNPDTPQPSSARETGGSKYVPPSLRPGADKSGGSRQRFDRDDSNTLKVTNLSEDTTEDDIRDLFRTFGHTTRVYLARDRNSHESRGFAFVTYQTRSDAEAAVRRLNGHGYDNLILHVEFAKPREEKKEGSK
jgi:translation initiation factor 3 subunit G